MQITISPLEERILLDASPLAQLIGIDLLFSNDLSLNTSSDDDPAFNFLKNGDISHTTSSSAREPIDPSYKELKTFFERKRSYDHEVAYSRGPNTLQTTHGKNLSDILTSARDSIMKTENEHTTRPFDAVSSDIADVAHNGFLSASLYFFCDKISAFLSR
jgi:hypothetical protein